MARPHTNGNGKDRDPMFEKLKSLGVGGTIIGETALQDDATYDWGKINVDIERDGSKITLPNDPAAMPIPEAVTHLQRRHQDDMREPDVTETIEAYPLDGAVAFLRALQYKYGWASPIPTQGFFGPENPEMITVKTGPGPTDTVQVPWGAFQVPGIENPIYTGTAKTSTGRVFKIQGTVRKKDSQVLRELAALTREIVKRFSIYRGKAIELHVDSDDEISWSHPPEFIDTSIVVPSELVLSRDVEQLVETNIFSLMRHTRECRKQKIPLKRGVLLEGPYGGGKSLTASVAAKVAVENGWTFVKLDRCQGLSEALEFAKRYEPALVFAEYIDRMTQVRDEDANDLLNIMSGALTHGSEVMCVLTTNHAEKINQAMLRPGRFDAVISIKPPDQEAVQRLIVQYARGPHISPLNMCESARRDIKTQRAIRAWGGRCGIGFWRDGGPNYSRRSWFGPSTYWHYSRSCNLGFECC